MCVANGGGQVGGASVAVTGDGCGLADGQVTPTRSTSALYIGFRGDHSWFLCRLLAEGIVRDSARGAAGRVLRGWSDVRQVWSTGVLPLANWPGMSSRSRSAYLSWNTFIIGLLVFLSIRVSARSRAVIGPVVAIKPLLCFGNLNNFCFNNCSYLKF